MTNASFDAPGVARRANARRALGVAGPTRRALVSRRADGFLVGWMGVLLWGGQQLSGENLFGASSGTLLSAVLIIQAAHFAMSYRLAYRGGRAAIQRHPVALGVTPLLLLVAVGAIALVVLDGGAERVRSITGALTTTVFVASGYHFVRQSYGVSRLGASVAGLSFSPAEAKTLNLAVLPLWASSLQPISVVRSFAQRFGTGFSESAFLTARVCAFASVVAIALSFGSAWRRTRIRPTSMMVAPFAAVSVWMLSPGGHVTAALAFTLTHSVQYLACTYRAERNHESTPNGWRGIRSSVYVLIVAAAVGTLLTRVLPQFADKILSAPDAPAMFAGLAFVFLNLNHYVTDAVIWKSKGALVRSLK
jgi:multisubunit Na+/H+ antiporter MnhB subunit